MAAMLKLAELTGKDRVYDLGCGDGRLLIAAASTYGCSGVGIDVDGELLDRARAGAAVEGVGDRLSFIQGDLFESDLGEATVVFIYLLPHLNLRLRPRLQAQLHSGARLISHQFDMGDWPPDTCLTLSPSAEDSVIYRWRIP
ncbi:MAG TPA: class I SAM-dependent methyltransferase [Leptolyngbyaceae cyanobacterium M65_K2018_010]|nr:class I SAM-dependent methyltransferase [Leptolyngbyaceae cyanobacterium M65_K2018_010]